MRKVLITAALALSLLSCKKDEPVKREAAKPVVQNCSCGTAISVKEIRVTAERKWEVVWLGSCTNERITVHHITPIKVGDTQCGLGFILK
jgi:hypothetical protein